MSRSAHKGFLDSEEALDQFLEAFFHHTLPRAEWTHAAHVTLAASQLYEADVTAVLPRVRCGIRSYNEAIGIKNTDTSGYHETLTVFWLKVVAQKLSQLQASSRLDAVRGAVAAYGEERALHKLYYSVDIVSETTARHQWVGPDLRQLS
jgi:hypothetical protein